MEQTKVPSTIRSTFFNPALSIFAAAILLATLNACTSMDRSLESGYANRLDEKSLNTTASDRKSYEQETAKAELGPYSNDRTIALRQALRKYEKMLEGKSEREQYFKAKPYLRDDNERLQFLRLESTSARERYLAAKGISGDTVTHPAEIQPLVDQNDVTIGMTRHAVRDSWGAPDEIDVAGNPIYGNEKWHYTEQVTSREGYMTERRTVYFEGGRVVGWETR